MGAAVQDIVSAFLQTYYQRMKKDPSKVSSLYSPTAELTHVNYQIDFDTGSDVLPTIKLTGKENISKFFTRNNKKVSDLKVRIDTCDFQTASNSSILILTTGEIFWSGTPSYRFCQTIILQPTSENKNAYDVTNDVIRFISDNWVPCRNLSSKMEEGAKQPKSPVLNGKPIAEVKVSNGELKAKKEPTLKSKKPEINSKAEGDLKETTPLDQNTSDEPIQDDKVDLATKEQKVSDDTELPDEPVAEKEADASEKKLSENLKNDSGVLPPKDKQKESETLTEAKGRPPARMSWASKLAASSDYIKTTSPVPASQSEPVKTDVPAMNTKRVPENKSDSLNQKDMNTTKSVKKKPQFSTVNKDGFYPIYIKGTAGIKEEKLKGALESEFGHIMKMTAADSFAVVDFESQKSQVEALERRQLTVGDTEVYLSRKTVKKSTGSPPVGSSNGARSHKKHSNKKRD